MAALGAVSLFGNTLVTISNITSPNGTNAPYQATVDGVANVTVICDDYYDLYSSPFTATVLFLSQLNSSDYKRTLYGRDAGSLATATSLYDEVAYLALQFSSNPMTNWAGIQIALWNIFDAAVGTQSPAPTGTPPAITGSASDPTSSAYWLAKAGEAANIAIGAANAGRIQILTPFSNGATGQPGFAGSQEFIVVVPEPKSYVILGSGLVLLSMLTFRRQRTRARTT